MVALVIKNTPFITLIANTGQVNWHLSLFQMYYLDKIFQGKLPCTLFILTKHWINYLSFVGNCRILIGPILLPLCIMGRRERLRHVHSSVRLGHVDLVTGKSFSQLFLQITALCGRPLATDIYKYTFVIVLFSKALFLSKDYMGVHIFVAFIKYHCCFMLINHHQQHC